MEATKIRSRRFGNFYVPVQKRLTILSEIVAWSFLEYCHRRSSDLSGDIINSITENTTMGIFSRFRDIVSANLNSMLEKAENPEKLIKLMIQEMEDTLVEMKASCASAMANKARVKRHLEDVRERADRWADKAKLAMEKGREDLAREAILEKKNLLAEVEARTTEVANLEELVGQYQDDIRQLEEKLQAARNKHRVLVQRHIHAVKRKTAQNQIRRADSSDAFVRFDQFESRIDRMEADADLVNYGTKKASSLEDEFEKLERDEDVERELEALKNEIEARRSEK